MEVEVLGVRGAPDEAVISIRAGALRRQTTVGALAAGSAFKIPVGPNGVNPFKVDLLQPAGSARLALRPEPGSYAAELKGAGQEGQDVRVDFTLKDGDDPAQAKAAKAADKAVPKEFAGVFQNSALAAKEYLESHQILTFVRALIQTLIRDQPNDPFGFIADQFRWASNKGGGKAACEGLDDPTATLGEGGEVKKEETKPFSQPGTPAAEKAPSPKGSDAEAKASPKPKTPPAELNMDHEQQPAPSEAPMLPEDAPPAAQPESAAAEADKAEPAEAAPQEDTPAPHPEGSDAEARASSKPKTPPAELNMDHEQQPEPVPEEAPPAAQPENAAAEADTAEPAEAAPQEDMPASHPEVIPSPVPSQHVASTVSHSEDTVKEVVPDQALLPPTLVPPPVPEEATDKPLPPAPEAEAQEKQVPREPLSTSEPKRQQEPVEKSQPPAPEAKAQEKEVPEEPLSPSERRRQQEVQQLRDDHAALQREVLELKRLLQMKNGPPPKANQTKSDVPSDLTEPEPTETDEQLRDMAKGTLFQANVDGSLEAQLSHMKRSKADSTATLSPKEVAQAKDPAEEGSGEDKVFEVVPDNDDDEEVSAEDLERAKAMACEALEVAILGDGAAKPDEGEPLNEEELEEARAMAAEALGVVVAGDAPELGEEEEEEAKMKAIESLNVLILDAPPELDQNEEEEARAKAVEALNVGLLDEPPQLDEEEEEEARMAAIDSLGVSMLDAVPQLKEDEEEVARRKAIEEEEARMAAIDSLGVSMLDAVPQLKEDEEEVARRKAIEALDEVLSPKASKADFEGAMEEGDLSPVENSRLKKSAREALGSALLAEDGVNAFGMEPAKASAPIEDPSRPSTAGSLRAPIRAANRSIERALDFHSGQLAAMTTHLASVHSQADDFLSRAFAESHSYHMARAKHLAKAAMNELELTPKASAAKRTEMGLGDSEEDGSVAGSADVPSDPMLSTADTRNPFIASSEHPLMAASSTPFDHLERLKAKAQAALKNSLSQDDDMETSKRRARDALRKALDDNSSDEPAEEEHDSEDQVEEAKDKARKALANVLTTSPEEEEDMEDAKHRARNALKNVLDQDPEEEEDDIEETKNRARNALKRALTNDMEETVDPQVKQASDMANTALQAAFAGLDLPPAELDKAMKAAQAALKKQRKEASGTGVPAADDGYSSGEIERAREKAKGALQTALTRSPDRVESTLRTASEHDEVRIGEVRDKARLALERAMDSGAIDDEVMQGALSPGSPPSALKDVAISHARESALKALGNFFHADDPAEGEEQDEDEELRDFARQTLVNATEDGTLDATLERVKSAESGDQLRDMARATFFDASRDGRLEATMAEVKAQEGEQDLRDLAQGTLVQAAADGSLDTVLAEEKAAKKEDDGKSVEELRWRAKKLFELAQSSGNLNDAVAEAKRPVTSPEASAEVDGLRKLAQDTLFRHVSTGALEQELAAAKTEGTQEEVPSNEPRAEEPQEAPAESEQPQPEPEEPADQEAAAAAGPTEAEAPAEPEGAGEPAT